MLLVSSFNVVHLCSAYIRPTHEKIQRVADWDDVSVALMTMSSSMEEL